VKYYTIKTVTFLFLPKMAKFRNPSHIPIGKNGTQKMPKHMLHPVSSKQPANLARAALREKCLWRVSGWILVKFDSQVVELIEQEKGQKG